MSEAILVLNAGSSSLKFTEFELDSGGTLVAGIGGVIEELDGAARFRAADADGGMPDEHRWDRSSPPGHAGALEFLLDWQRRRVRNGRLIAVGHRVVHGGNDFGAPVIVDADVLSRLDGYVSLAPLHQPQNLLAIRAIGQQRPDLLQVACFDTAFHRTAAPLVQAFALPAWITRRGVRRYGFHGLSYEYIASVLAQHDPQAATGRTVVLHLGNGASMCALRAGCSVASSMGFTAVDGLPMGTRSGALDPGVVLYCMQELGMDAAAIESLLYKESGLLGVSGISSDMRALLASNDPAARFAIDLFVYRIGRELGSLAAALGGLDAIVFTAGIGEHAPAIREAVCRQAGWLGVEFDAAANGGGGPRISSASSRVAAWVIPTNEELMIARHTLALAR